MSAQPEANQSADPPKRGLAVLWPRILFLIPVVAALWVGVYDRIEPRLLGVPFFYWYQLGLVLVCAVVVVLVYVLEKSPDA
jgi:membrane protein implicated in regulation of membrane protease activity